MEGWGCRLADFLVGFFWGIVISLSQDSIERSVSAIEISEFWGSENSSEQSMGHSVVFIVARRGHNTHFFVLFKGGFWDCTCVWYPTVATVSIFCCAHDIATARTTDHLPFQHPLISTALTD